MRLEPGAEENNVVFAFDILLDDLFDQISRMTPSDNSRVFIFRRDARLYMPRGNGNAPEFKSISEVKDLLIKAMYASWSTDSQKDGYAFSIKHDDGTWWGGFRALENEYHNLWVGVMVPEADIVGGVKRRRSILGTVAALVTLAAGGLIFWIIRRHSAPIDNRDKIFDHNAPVESIQRLISAGEGDVTEFKSTMRMNLHTGKTGKEIEIAWLKTVAAFMNTKGGVLLLGVGDDGEIRGLEADAFDNEDKCKLHFKNLVNQHIGAELSKYIQFTIARVEGKNVGVVVCTPSKEPAFLKANKKEAFYIRNGPSSEELPVSKVLSYIQNRY